MRGESLGEARTPSDPDPSAHRFATLGEPKEN